MADSSELRTTLAELRDRIARLGSRAINEQNTKATLIEPLLRVLGWNVEEFDEVQREYKVVRRDKPVDYALLTLRTPRLLLEAKSLGKNLDDRRWLNQMMGYAAVAGVKWMVLTDGNEYSIYNSHESVPVDQKLFRSVKLTDDNPFVEETLRLLVKHRIEENLIDVLWRAQFVDLQVKAAIKGLFDPESDLVLVNYLAKNTTNLTVPEIRASMARCTLKLDFPVPAAGEASAVASPKKKARPSAKEAPSLDSPARHTVTLEDLIRSRVLQPPLGLQRSYKGQEFNARVEANGSVSFGGDAYDTLSSAAGAARATVIGKKSDGSLPATNGWTFWRFVCDDGKKQEVDHLRQEYLRAHGGEGASGTG